MLWKTGGGGEEWEPKPSSYASSFILIHRSPQYCSQSHVRERENRTERFDVDALRCVFDVSHSLRCSPSNTAPTNQQVQVRYSVRAQTLFVCVDVVRAVCDIWLCVFMNVYACVNVYGTHALAPRTRAYYCGDLDCDFLVRLNSRKCFIGH